MAGIGFSLKRLFGKKGFFALCRAYGYAGVICCGPMALSMLMMLALSFIAKLGGMDSHDRELLNVMLTYSLLASLTATSWLNMVVTRYTSDMIYTGQSGKIMPSFYGSLLIMFILGGVPYGIFLCFSGVAFTYKILCLWYMLILVVVWTEMIYLSAIKDYRGILLSFTIAMLTGFLLTLICVVLGRVSVTSLFVCVIIGYGLLMVLYYRLLVRFFLKNEGNRFSFLRWLDRYHSLAFTGGLINLGLYAHLVIMYFGPLRVQIEGLFYSAPLHDVPALMAFLSILITTINFVTAAEVRFYPKYRNYYSLFNDHGAIRDIMQAEKEMLTVLEQELTVNAQKQLITSILFIVFGRIIMGYSALGLNEMSLGIFMILCVGYGLYAVSNSNMLMLMYFEDYTGPLLGSLGFALVSVTGTVLQNIYGNPKYYGLSFTLGALVFYIIIWLRLEWYTRRLPYFLLCRQEFVGNGERGIFAWLSRKFDSRDTKRSEKSDKRRTKRADKKLDRRFNVKEPSIEKAEEKKK